MTTADVRVGIVSWNTAALLDRCLSALPAALGGLRAEVIVVDNASADGTAAAVRRHYPSVRLAGLTRKSAIPLLEYFDREKVTLRIGDKRVLRKGER